MADGRIEIDTKIDTSGVEKGAKQLNKQFKSVESSSKNLATTIGAVTVAVGVATKIISQISESYSNQVKAEIQLETASKNNPYLNSSNVKALKNYASELQGISTVGDEELIPFMASLATAGRTQEEIMDIMTVAVDMQATGMYSLDSAVKNLNKTYGGLSGELGETIPEVKNLTTEQLKNGDAVKLLGNKYKGMAQNVVASTPTEQIKQLKNAFGDLTESAGKTLFSVFGNGTGSIISKIKDGISGLSSFINNTVDEFMLNKKLKNMTQAEFDLIEASERASISTNKYEQAKQELQEASYKLSQRNTKKYRESVDDLIIAVDYWRKQEAIAEEQLKIQEKLTAETKKIAEQKILDDKALDHIKAVTAEREKQLEVLRLTAQAQGGQGSKQDELNAYMSSYIKLISESDGLITEGNSEAIKLMEKIKALSGEVAGELNTEKLENDYKDFLDKCKELSKKDMKESELMAEELSILETEYANLTADQKKAIEEEYTNAHKALMDKQTEQAKAEAEAEVQAKKDALAENLSIANDFATQYAEITNSIVALASKQTDDEATIKTAEIEKQYADGIISQEEYEKKKAEIDKESAEKKYKLDMWAWSASILTATANTAMGVTKALAEGGMVTGALVGVAGAVQLATIIANKPIKPSFATGGIVGGNSFYGDKVSANLNSGEMILNARQQQNMFKAIDRNTLGGGTGANIKIYNSASNDVSARPEITEDGIKILIRKTVSKDMNDGRFNSSMRTAQSSFSGNRFTS